MVNRRFVHSVDTLQSVVDFVGSLGYLSNEFQIIKSYPKLNVSFFSMCKLQFLILFFNKYKIKLYFKEKLKLTFCSQIFSYFYPLKTKTITIACKTQKKMLTFIKLTFETLSYYYKDRYLDFLIGTCLILNLRS